MSELSRRSVELTITVSDPELRVTAGWPADDEIRLARAASSFVARSVRLFANLTPCRPDKLTFTTQW
jgi:hypothetical protein